MNNGRHKMSNVFGVSQKLSVREWRHPSRINRRGPTWKRTQPRLGTSSGELPRRRQILHEETIIIKSMVLMKFININECFCNQRNILSIKRRYHVQFIDWRPLGSRNDRSHRKSPYMYAENGTWSALMGLRRKVRVLGVLVSGSRERGSGVGFGLGSGWCRTVCRVEVPT